MVKAKLSDILKRKTPPLPWAEGDNIPWNDPEFSRRMLKEHLSQESDAASRKFEIIDRHVDWIHTEVLAGVPSRILDLCCGPGFYTQRLARLRQTCLGIDYSPASIEYATREAENEVIYVRYKHEDVRTADFGNDFNLAVMIYGEFNVFKPSDAKSILNKIQSALAPGGILLFEPHTYETIEKIGHEPSTWYTAESGLFSDKPHFCLQENFWDPNSKTATRRYLIIDSATGETTSYAATYQTYSEEDYELLLTESGFKNVRKYPSLSGGEDDVQEGLVVYKGQKKT